jgi:crotonobetainyl-CoA:carnitine CoA-transferase CaiB-like acyl-CoA transferase
MDDAMQPLLSEIRVLDLTRMLAGPYGSLLLADLGAEVIKIEPPGGDPMRQMGPYFVAGESAYFLSINRNKESICLDLKSEHGRQAFLDLAERSDVVFENFRPGVMEGLGLGYKSLKNVKPDIILCSISGYGRNGPRRDQPAFDLALQAAGGSMSVTGEPDRDPVRMGVPMGDLAGGMFGALAVAAALQRRAQTGEGAHLDISLFDGQVSLLTYMAQYYLVGGAVPERWGAQHESVVPYNAYATADGHLVVAIFTEKFWTAFCRALELEKLIDDPRFTSNADRRKNRDVLNAILAERFLAKSTAEWIERLQAAQVPANPIQSVDQVMNDPQVAARNMRLSIDHPTIGPLEIVGNPIKVDGLADSFRPPPLMGEQTAAVLQRLLGYSDERVRQFTGDDKTTEKGPQNQQGE